MNVWANRKRAGFTIVELLIVIIVIAILAAISVVAYRGAMDRATESELRADLSQAARQLEVDKISNGDIYPSTTSSADGGKGLLASNGTNFEYTVNNSGSNPTYCLSGVNGRSGFHIVNGSSPLQGVCPGHAGPAGDGGSSLSCDAGFVKVPGDSRYGTSDFCVAKYEAKDDGSGKAVSKASGTPWVNTSQNTASALAVAACSGCHLITEAEWLTIATNVLNVPSNWTNGSVGSGRLNSGHSRAGPSNSLAASTDDSSGYYGIDDISFYPGQRRTLTLSNGEVVWDMSGNVFEWTAGQISGTKPLPNNGWREYNTITSMGTLPASALPSFATSSSSVWTATDQGIGVPYISSNTSSMAFRRGGIFNGGYTAGIFTVVATDAPSTTNAYAGFRIVK